MRLDCYKKSTENQECKHIQWNLNEIKNLTRRNSQIYTKCNKEQEKLNENCLSWDQPSKAVFKSPNHAES